MNNDVVLTLPFVLDNTVKCYLCNAFFGGILSSYKNMEGWIIEHYIQLFYVGKRKVLHSTQIESQINYYGAWTEPMELFEKELFDVDKLIKIDVIDLIRKRILGGFYCFTYMDEYYVGKRQHNAHDVIIIGIDDTEKCLSVVGYFNRQYSMRQISFQTFEKAFESGIRITLHCDHESGHEYLKLFRPLFDDEMIYQIHMDNIIERCNEYAIIGNIE